MPDVIDCTTCLYEPKWSCDGTGECRFEAYPAWAMVQHYIRKKPDGDLIFCVRLGYEDDCFAYDCCPAYQAKDQPCNP